MVSGALQTCSGCSIGSIEFTLFNELSFEMRTKCVVFIEGANCKIDRVAELLAAHNLEAMVLKGAVHTALTALRE